MARYPTSSNIIITFHKRISSLFSNGATKFQKKADGGTSQRNILRSSIIIIIFSLYRIFTVLFLTILFFVFLYRTGKGRRKSLGPQDTQSLFLAGRFHKQIFRCHLGEFI